MSGAGSAGGRVIAMPISDRRRACERQTKRCDRQPDDGTANHEQLPHRGERVPIGVRLNSPNLPARATGPLPRATCGRSVTRCHAPATPVQERPKPWTGLPPSTAIGHERPLRRRPWCPRRSELLGNHFFGLNSHRDPKCAQLRSLPRPESSRAAAAVLSRRGTTGACGRKLVNRNDRNPPVAAGACRSPIEN